MSFEYSLLFIDFDAFLPDKTQHIQIQVRHGYFHFSFHILQHTYMAAAIGKTHCVTCKKDKVAYKCGGCSQDFCFNHLADHRQLLGKELDHVEDRRNLFRETLAEQTTNPQKHALIERINRWEKDSINKIRQTAEEARKVLLEHTTEHLNSIEKKLDDLTKQLKIIREENDFNEIHLDQFRGKLKQLEDELNKPSTISVREDSSPYISKISVVVSSGE